MQQTGVNKRHVKISCKLDADGMMSGQQNCTLQGQYAADLRRAYRQAKDSTDFVSTLQQHLGAEFISYQAKGLHEFTPAITEIIKFNKQATTSDQFIYLNPMIFMHISSSPFKMETRTQPIEFGHFGTHILHSMIELPEGYSIDEMPENIRLNNSDGTLSIRYQAHQVNNRVILRYEFNIKRLLYAPQEYAELKNFFEYVSEQNNRMIVLKKNN